MKLYELLSRVTFDELVPTLNTLIIKDNQLPHDTADAFFKRLVRTADNQIALKAMTSFNLIFNHS